MHDIRQAADPSREHFPSLGLFWCGLIFAGAAEQALQSSFSASHHRTPWVHDGWTMSGDTDSDASLISPGFET